MTETKVINYKQLPSHLPWQTTAITFLLGDHYKWTQTMWGVWATLNIIMWIIGIVAMCIEKKCSVKFED